MIKRIIIFGIPYALFRTCKLLKQNIPVEIKNIKLLLKYWTVYSLLLSIIYIFENFISWIPLSKSLISIFIILLQIKDIICIRIFDVYIQGTFDIYEIQLDKLVINIFAYIKHFLSSLFDKMLCMKIE